jgi:nucleotide-binding universal stress UspA family protein
LPYARALTERLDADVELLAVIDQAEIPVNVSAEQAALSNNVLGTRKLDQYLTQIAKSFPRIRTHCRVEQGTAAAVIIDTAAANKETLIIMATHGRSGLYRWLLGSVAEKVLRGTSNSLLLIRASEQAPTDGQATFGSIVVPLDGSKLGELALAPALELARSMKIEMVLARAYELPATAYYRADDYPPSAQAFIPSYAELAEEMSRESREYIDAKVKELRSQGLEQVRSQVLEGNAAEEIIKLARSAKGSLIAMCTHGRSGPKRWVLGSVTEKVVHYSPSPVLVVRGT